MCGCVYVCVCECVYKPICQRDGGAERVILGGGAAEGLALCLYLCELCVCVCVDVCVDVDVDVGGSVYYCVAGSGYS